VLEQWVAKQTERLSASRGDIGQQSLMLGLILAGSGRSAQAIEWLSKAPAGVQKSLALGLCYLQTDQLEKALAEFDSAKSHGADGFTVAINKVEALRRLKRLDEAQALLKTCEAMPAPKETGESLTLIGKTKADYWYQLGRLSEARQDRQQALEHYQKALQIQENHQGAHFRLGYYCDLAGDDEAAVEHYRQCTSDWPVHVNALLNLAVLYEDAEKYDQAESCLRKILSAQPNHPRAGLYLRDILSTKTMYYDEDQERQQDRRNQVLEIPVTDFELSVRSRNCLKSMGLNTLGDLMRVTEADLLNYKNFGETSLREIKVILAQKGLRLGQLVEDQTKRTLLDGEVEDETENDSAGIINLPLSEVSFSLRVKRCLADLQVETLGDIIKYSAEDLLARKNFGQTSLEEVKNRLAEHGLTLASSQPPAE